MRTMAKHVGGLLQVPNLVQSRSDPVLLRCTESSSAIHEDDSRFNFLRDLGGSSVFSLVYMKRGEMAKDGWRGGKGVQKERSRSWRIDLHGSVHMQEAMERQPHKGLFRAVRTRQ